VTFLLVMSVMRSAVKIIICYLFRELEREGTTVDCCRFPLPYDEELFMLHELLLRMSTSTHESQWVLS
jgi:hypothetical protein